MPIVTPNFNFAGQCEEALYLYERAFHAHISRLIRNRDVRPDNAAGHLIYHAEMLIGDQRIMASDNMDLPFNPSLSLSLTVTMDTKEEVLQAYEILKEGGKIVYPPESTLYSSCFVSLTDRFGFRWVIMTEQTDR